MGFAMKKMISMVLVLTMLVGLVPVSVNAAGTYNYKSGYGGQLTNGQKAMYDGMVDSFLDGALADETAESAKCSFERGSYVTTTAQFQTDLEAAFVAFIYDYPQVFWMEMPDQNGISVSAMPSGDLYEFYSVELSFTETYEGAKDLVSEYNKGIKAAAEEIRASVGMDASKYDYYLAIHDWLCEKLTYNSAALNNSKTYPEAYTSGPVFAGNGSVTCQGYSEAFKALCDFIRYTYNVELYAASVVGTTKSNARHMWNCAYLDGNWYGVDVQFDDQGSESHNYFLCGANTKIGNATYASEHVEKQSFSTNSAIIFAYPVLASEEYEVPADTPDVPGADTPDVNEPDKPDEPDAPGTDAPGEVTPDEDDTEVPGPEKLAFSAVSLVLQDNLAMNFKVKRSLFTEDGYREAYVVFDLNGTKTTVKNCTVDGDYYVYTFTDIAPNQMNDVIKATIYADYNGTEYESDVFEHSVADYCYNMLDTYSSNSYKELRTLLVDLLVYGGKVQKYTDYNTRNLADAKLTSTQKSWGTSKNRTYVDVANAQYKKIEDPSVIWKAAGLRLEDTIVMRFKIAADSINNLTLKVEGVNGTSWSIPSDGFVKTDGGYYVYFDGLNAAQLSETVYVTVYNGKNAVSNTLSYSVESYAYAKQNDSDTELAELVKAMMNYGDSAAAYVK